MSSVRSAVEIYIVLAQIPHNRPYNHNTRFLFHQNIII